VQLVLTSSENLSSPSNDIPVLDIGKAMKNDQFMRFQSLLQPMVDIRQYRDGWIINDVIHLTKEITDEDIKLMELALGGVVPEEKTGEATVDTRDLLLQRTERFHFVTKSICRDGVNNIPYYQCDCRDYYFHRWCFPTAYMQHREDLRYLGQEIATKKSCSRKLSRSAFITKALDAAAAKLGQK
jgi:hypothetical protein